MNSKKHFYSRTEFLIEAPTLTELKTIITKAAEIYQAKVLIHCGISYSGFANIDNSRQWIDPRSEYLQSIKKIAETNGGPYTIIDTPLGTMIVVAVSGFNGCVYEIIQPMPGKEELEYEKAY